ncbi:unnamed protein product [Gordionus sp. m RMFG-2023]
MQTSQIFQNDKEFLHMRLKRSPSKIKSSFELLSQNLTTFDKRLKQFLNENFEKIPTKSIQNPITQTFLNITEDMELWKPDDWVSRPDFLKKIKDERLRQLANRLHFQWLDLSRKINRNVKRNKDRYTIMYMRDGFILPSFLAAEMRYFDNYFIVRAMLLAGMNETAKGIIRNMVDLIEENNFNMTPYGNRIYFKGYSSIPLLILTVYEYWKISNDTHFVISILKQLEIDNNYWINKQSYINRAGRIYPFSTYQVSPNSPRPFEYNKDIRLAKTVFEESVKKLYTNIGSMTESIWEESSRWNAEKNDDDPFRSVRIIEMIPVDLNAILCLNERLLSFFYNLAESTMQSTLHERRCRDKISALKLLWDDENGVWFDMESQNEKLINIWYASSMVPLFTQCYGDGLGGKSNITYESRVLAYFKKMKLHRYLGGVPISKYNSNLDWDMPYTNAAVMLMIIEGLEASELSSAKMIARDLAQKWILANLKSYRDTEKTFKRIDVNNYAKKYPEIEEIYSSTNAVILILLDKYGDTLIADTAIIKKINIKSSASTIYTFPLRIQSTLNSLYLMPIYIFYLFKILSAI